jgi:flagellar protein FlaG
MASVSVSTLIIFIAAMGIAVTVSGTMVDSVAGISDSITDRGTDLSKRIDTDIEVISDAGSDAVYDAGANEVTLLVKNTGERSLPTDPGQLDVLVDGQYVASSALSTQVLDGSAWEEGAVLELTIDRSLDGGEHRVVVVLDGEREVFAFNI